MTEPLHLHIALDVRASRTLLATVQNQRVIDTRRVEHGAQLTAAELAKAVAVLRARAPGPVLGLAGIWRHAERLEAADPSQFVDLLADVGRIASLPTWWLPQGAALTLGESLRAPAPGPLAVLALDVGVTGGVVTGGRLFDPHRLDLGHLSIQAEGYKCDCGARGCLHGYASETALAELSRDLGLSLERPTATDWQTLKGSHLAQFQLEKIRESRVLTERAGRAIGVAAGHLEVAFGVVEVRVRARHPDQWRVLQSAADAAVRQVSGARAPKLTAADPGEDGYFVGAVAARR